MRYLRFLILWSILFSACSDNDAEADTCVLSFEDRVYSPFERIDLVSTIPPEDFEILSQDIPVLVLTDEAGPYILAPLSQNEVAVLEVRKPESCSSLEVHISSISEADTGLDGILGKLRELTVALPQSIGAKRVPAPDELGGDIDQVDYAAGVVAQYQAGLDKLVESLSAEERTQLAGMLRKSGLWEVIDNMPQFVSPPLNAFWIPTEFEKITSAADLSSRMVFAAHFCTVAHSQGANIASALGATVAASKNIYFKAGATAFSAATFVAFANATLVCATHPETLSNPHMEPGTIALEEDAELWTATEFTVTAKSGPPANLAALAAGLAFVFKSIAGTGIAAKDALASKEALLNGFAGSEILKSLSETIGGKVIEQTVGPAEFGGWEWANIDIAGEEWVTVIPAGNIFAQQSCDKLCLRPLMVGSERVIFVPKVDKFPYSTPEFATFGTVHPIVIEFGPNIIPVEPGQLLGFVYSVDWAIDPRLEWLEKTQTDRMGVVLDSTTDKEGVMVYTTPLDEGLYPIEISATSLSQTGLRAPAKSPIPRNDQSLLVLEALIVGPDGNCVSPGERMELFASASNSNGEIAEIEWAPATMVQNGVFTAPATPGNYTLTATASYATQPSISEEVVVNVGDCGCWISVNGSILNARHDFDMTNAWTIGGDGTGVVSVIIDGKPLVISLATPTSEMPEGSFLSGVSLSTDDGIWGSDAINTRIHYESDGVHYQGLMAGVFMDGDKTGYASISFRGVRPLSSQACKSRTLYNGSLPSLIKDATETP